MTMDLKNCQNKQKTNDELMAATDRRISEVYFIFG